jgi:hypothetical protein
LFFSFAAFVCRKKVATNRINKITELRQQSSELKDELARVAKEFESNLVMTETVTLPTQVELKRAGRGGKWQQWVIRYICELLVIGTPPASIPSIISSSYQTYYGKEPDEVPQMLCPSMPCDCASHWRDYHSHQTGISRKVGSALDRCNDPMPMSISSIDYWIDGQ